MSAAGPIQTKRRGGIGRLLRGAAARREYGVAGLILLTAAAVSAQNRAFLSAQNFEDMLVNTVPAAIAACGLTLVIVTGEIDISIGSSMGLLAVVLGMLTSPSFAGWPVGAGIAATLLLGTAIGFLVGALVVYGGAPSIIVTLGMLTALRGGTKLMLESWITDMPGGLRWFGVGRMAGIPVCLWAAIAVIGFTIVLARLTPLGRRIYAVGSSPHAARLAGLSARRAKLFAFTFTGFLTAVATLVSIPQMGSIDTGIGAGFELLVVSCVVVGGASISGGMGTIVGSVLGALLLVNIRTVLIYLRLGEMPTYWERAIQGGFILLAVLLDHFARRRSAERE